MKKNRILLIAILLLPLLMVGQTVIKGTVIDETNMPVSGASVLVKGTTKGTATDFDGNFELEVDKLPQTIEISYLGYQTKDVKVTDDNPINVKLIPDAQQLQEIVVVGYGVSTKKDLTGSITSIKPTEEAAEQARSIEDVIKGRSAGVQVRANGSEPGASVSVKIRGTSSLTTNSEPLYVVDGIIMDSATEGVENPLSGYAQTQGGGISGINPSDIASIEILKDASATAIYGSRAANGVIIITTKKGKKGKAKFNYNTSYSLGRVVRNIDVLDTFGYVNYQNDVSEALGVNPKYIINSPNEILTNTTPPIKIQGIDWAEDTYRPSVILKNRLSVSGGGEKGDYYISGGISRNQGTFPNALSKSIDFNLKLNQKLTDKIKLSTKIATSYTNLSAAKGPDAFGSANHSMVRQILLSAPILNFSENNLDNDDVEESLDGPRAWAKDYDDLGNEMRLLGAITADFKLTKSLTYRMRFGGDYRKKERSFWYGRALLRGRNANGLAGIGTLNRFRYNFDNTLMYKKRFNKNHRLNATIGALLDKKSIQKSRYSAANFADHSLRADGISFGATYTPLYIDSEYPTIVSFIGRANYTLYKKYLFTATIRADGSSKFAKGKRWGYFPSFSFAWRAIRESMFKDQDVLSDLKIRLGYGQVGNQNIPPYSYITPFVSAPSALSDASGGNLIAVVPSNLANPDLTWETSIQYNAGIDFGFLDDRITGTIDTYKKISSDLLIKVPIGPSSGFDSMIVNQGSIENQGIEFSLNGDIVKNENFNWNLFTNISFNKNKISDLGEINPAEYGALGEVTAFLGTQVSGGNYFKQPANIFILNHESGLFYGLQTKGIIRNNDQLTDTPTGDPLQYNGVDLNVGDVRFVDQNGDGDITDEDKTIIGNPNPDFTFGFGTSFDYKGLNLSLMFNGVYGNDIVNGDFLSLGYANTNTKNIRTDAYQDAFDPISNPNGDFPYVGFNNFTSDYSRDFNDRAVEDGSYLRLSYVALSYNVPVERIKFISNLKFTLSGKNLWLLTNYTGFDPEVNSFAFDPLRVGIDWGSFPNQRSFALGLNVTF